MNFLNILGRMRATHLAFFALSISALGLVACGPTDSAHNPAAQTAHDASAADEPEKGPNGGRMLRSNGFAIELDIFETGVPPEYHAWPTQEGEAVPLDEVELVVKLERLGDVVDRFDFSPKGDYLLGDGVVTEPHSFRVVVEAKYGGKRYDWAFDSYEGRTTIPAEIAATAGVRTETAGPQTLIETVPLYGQIVARPDGHAQVAARFPGVIRSVSAALGQTVRRGQALAVIESDDSLRRYTITAPIDGTISQQSATVGEHSGQRTLFAIVDARHVVANLAVFPAQRGQIKVGAAVTVTSASSPATARGQVTDIGVMSGPNQAVTARVLIDNADGQFAPGTQVTARVMVAEHAVPLAVKRSGLQAFRDFTVVYALVDETYEVRMLDLGQAHGDWIEVLGGLAPGTRYVTENSFLIKADIEKSGASHDH